MTGEILTHYEEGTFTPIWTSSDGNGTFTYGAQTGRYTLIGRIVHCVLYIRVTACSSLPTGSYSYVGGLPFTSVNDTTGAGDGATVTWNWFTARGNMSSGRIPMAYKIKNNNQALMGALGHNDVQGVTPSMHWGSSTWTVGQGAYYAYGEISYEIA